MRDPQQHRRNAGGGRLWGLASIVAIAAVVALGPWAGEAAAQTSGEWVATVRAQARAPLPPHSSLTVSPRDFDDVSMRLQGVIEERLRQRGYGVGETGGSGLQLWFDTELSEATVTGPDRPENATEVGAQPVDDEMLGRGSDVADDDRDEAEVMPQATIRFGARGPAQPGTPYSLTFIVGRPGETPIWQGAVTTRIGDEDPFDVAQAMVPLLINQIGNTVRAEANFP